MPGTPEPDPTTTVVAFDFGLRRIGVAVGQQVTGSASPLGIVANTTSGPDWDAIERIIDEWRPGRLIVGMPCHADGSPSDMSLIVDKFILTLRRFDLPVAAVDERYTSVEAQDALKSRRAEGQSRRIRKEQIDSAAAVLIAERWLGQNNRPADELSE